MNTDAMPSRVIGHRGAKGLAPENTLAGVRAAAEAGADWVEFDVQLSADGEPALFHDDDIERVTGDLGRFVTIPWTILKTLDAGAHFSPAFVGTPIPTLTDAMVELGRLGLGANVEIKLARDATDEMVEKTARVVADALKADWPASLPLPLLSSFDVRALKAVQGAAPDLPRAYIVVTPPLEWKETALGLGCVALHVAADRITDEVIAEAHAAGLAVRAYTVNDRAEADTLLARGVDGIFTDFPNIMTGL